MVQHIRHAIAVAMLVAIAAASGACFSLTQPVKAQTPEAREAAECRAAMRAVAEAEQTYRAHTPGHAYTLDVMDIQALDRFPVCPSGGQLSVAISHGSLVDRAEDGRIVPSGGLIVRCPRHGVLTLEAK